MKELLETLNITDENKVAIAQYMQDQVKKIKAECFEEFSKKYNFDKEKTMEALNNVVNSSISEEKKKNDLHRKKLIESKLALQKEKDNLEKILADRTQAIKEEYAKKFEDARKDLIKENADKFNKMVVQVQNFINESVKSEVKNLRSTKRKLSEAVDTFGKFISENTKKCVAIHMNEARKFDAMKVRMVKENQQELAKAKKKFYQETAEMAQKYISESCAREIRNFRQDLINARKNEFGTRIFEAFKNEFKKNYFNEDKAAKNLLESVSKKVANLNRTVSKLDKEKNTLVAENKNLNAVKEKLMREKIISESISFLPAKQQSMMRNLLTGCKTSELKESIKRYLPSIVGENATKQINKSEGNKLLKENKMILTGADNRRVVRKAVDESLSPELQQEIDEIIASSKL